MSRIFCFVLGLIMLLTCMPIIAYGADITVSAESAIVMIASTGQIVYEKNAYEKRGMASTTKIMSSIIALENGNLQSEIKASAEDVAVEGTSLGLKAGDTVDLSTLVRGMLLSSGNDSANVAATLVGGSREGFVELMNQKARELGMASTHFVNPSGLTEEGHYSTAYDMALLGSYAIKNKLFRSICSSSDCVVSFGSPATDRVIYNHNKFLSMYDGALGIKTGFTKASGRCLVTAVQRDGVALVGVTLNAPDDWNDHIRMMDYSFSRIGVHCVPVEEPLVDVVCSDKSMVKTRLVGAIEVPYCNEVPEYTVSVYVKPFVYAEVRKNDYLGYVDVSFENGFFSRTYLVSSEDAFASVSDNTESTPLDRFKEFLRKGLS